MQFNFDTIYDTIAAEKTRFLGAFFLVALITYALLYAVDFIPEPVSDSQNTSEGEQLNGVAVVDTEATVQPASGETAVSAAAAQPVKIIFDALDKEIDVLNPTSRNIEALDSALLSGAVRHPDSANFQNTGNIFILGHSSYLPNVLNKNFQAFNGLQDLEWGDTIRLQSADTEYIYRVDTVYQARAAEVTVPVDGLQPKLTLATCNSFGAKDDRFVVEATLVEEVAL